MRHDTFCWLGKIISSPNGQFEARGIYCELGGVNRWLHQDDRRHAYMRRRVGQAWKESPMRIGIASWWPFLITAEEWPPDGLTHVAIGDDGTLIFDYDGDSHLSRIWTGRAASSWRASLSWNARNWRIERRR